MSNVTSIQKVAEETITPETMLALAAGGDCKGLSPGQRLAYYRARCEAAGLDPSTHPFEFTNLNGKLVLYAKKAATDGLCAKHNTSITIPSQVTEGGVRTVTAHATDPAGRVMEDVGCVWVDQLKGDALANAHMKAVTKAKRRTVLSMYGLGMLDETEVADIQASEPPPRPRPEPTRPVVEVLPPAGKIEAPALEAARTVTVEAKAEPPKNSAPPPYVMALWNRLVKQEGGNKKLAKMHWDKAAESVHAPIQSSDWTAEHAAMVESALWPKDVA